MFGRQLFESAELCIYFYSLWARYPGSHSTLYTRERGRENASLKIWKLGHARPKENMVIGRSSQWPKMQACKQSSSSCGPRCCRWVKMKEKQKVEVVRTWGSPLPLILSSTHMCTASIFSLLKAAMRIQIGKEPGLIRQKEYLI